MALNFSVDLMLSLDPGTSMTKMLFCVIAGGMGQPEMLCMEPELIKMGYDSLKLYEAGRI